MVVKAQCSYAFDTDCVCALSPAGGHGKCGAVDNAAPDHPACGIAPVSPANPAGGCCLGQGRLASSRVDHHFTWRMISIHKGQGCGLAVHRRHMHKGQSRVCRNVSKVSSRGRLCLAEAVGEQGCVCQPGLDLDFTMRQTLKCSWHKHTEDTFMMPPLCFFHGLWACMLG